MITSRPAPAEPARSNSKSTIPDPVARAEYERLMQRDGMVREFEYQVRTRTDAVLWLSDSASAVRNDAGEIVR